jgi:hypothetical protein
LHHRVWHIGAHEGTFRRSLSWTCHTGQTAKFHFPVGQFLGIYIMVKFCIKIIFMLLRLYCVTIMLLFILWKLVKRWWDLVIYIPLSPMSITGLLNFSFVQMRAL